MKIKTNGFALPFGKALIQIIEKECSNADVIQGNSCTLNFKDPTYSVKTGGYHPVEIMLNEYGVIQYITDFSYASQCNMSELAKEIDFDLSSGTLEHFGRCYPIEDANELFQVWQKNFCAYYEKGIFKISASTS